MPELENLIPYSNMDRNGWSGGTISSEHVMSGNQSLRLDGTASSPEITANTVDTIQLFQSHIYYARIYGYQDLQSGSVGFYWPIAEPSLQEGIPTNISGQWNLYSARSKRIRFSDGLYQFRIDYNNSYIANSIWFDCCMLIDLTACFGAGNEPTKEWCDNYIPYFDGMYTLQEWRPLIITANCTPNPVAVGSPFVISAMVIDAQVGETPETFYGNEIRSGEV